MNDTEGQRPDHSALFQLAASQRGHFTTAQAHSCGFGTDLITHHVKNGRFVRIFRGVYRLRDYPSAPFDEVVAAWLAAGREAVVSHDSSLALLDLSDVIPESIHLTVPRSRRYRPSLPGVRLHTSTYPLGPGEVIEREGVKLTSAERSIVDAADAGTGPEQIVLAVRQAVRRGIALPISLRALAAARGSRVTRIIDRSLEGAA